MATLSIDRIEDELADRGIEATYSGGDDYTSYNLTYGSKELEILDGVSGAYFRSEYVTEVNVYPNTFPEPVTDRFAEVETIEEFLEAVADVLGA